MGLDEKEVTEAPHVFMVWPLNGASFQPSQPQQQADQVPEILPNDPGPSVAPKDGASEDIWQSDDSLEFLSSTSEEEPEPESVDAMLHRSDRLHPIKKRKVVYEVIGGGLVPRKTSLAQGPKFVSRKDQLQLDDSQMLEYIIDEKRNRIQSTTAQSLRLPGGVIR